VDRALGEHGLGWDAWPEVTADAALDDQVRLSALLLLLATPQPRVEVPGGQVLPHDRAPEVIDRLRRRQLPWDPDAARLALVVVAEREDFDDRRVGVALRGAELVCSAGGADAALLEALLDCARWLDTLPVHVWRVPEMRLQVRRVMAAAAPPDLLDLSPLEGGDTWGGPARAAARGLPADDVAPLVRRLGQLGSRKPSQAWFRAVEDALQPAAARRLLTSWLRLAAHTDVIPADPAIDSSGGILFAGGNNDVVPAAVLATRLLPQELWVAEVLGVLARRGAATSGVPGMTQSLALRVASAAVDTLATRGTLADLEVLEQLLRDLSRRDLVKKVGAALGQQQRAAQRESELRTEKAAAVRRKANPAPRQARAGADGLIRRYLSPELRRQGFSGSGRTWRRLHADRVDIIGVRWGDELLALTYGARFDAVHPDGEPYPVERSKVRDHHLDTRLFEDWQGTHEGLERCAAHLRSVVVPFLDTLGRYELARAYLRDNAGTPASSRRLEDVDSPAVSAVLGMLGLTAGDRATAELHLGRRLDLAESRAELASASNNDAADTDVAFWRAQLRKAHRLR